MSKQAALEALRSMRTDATRKRLRGADEGGVTVRIYTGSAQPGPDSEAFGTATDMDKEFPGHSDEDEDEDE